MRSQTNATFAQDVKPALLTRGEAGDLSTRCAGKPKIVTKRPNFCNMWIVDYEAESDGAREMPDGGTRASPPARRLTAAGCEARQG